MYYTVYNTNNDELIQSYESNSFDDDLKQQIVIGHPSISISMDIIDLSGAILLSKGTYSSNENVELFSKSDEDTIELSFFLHGSMAVKALGFDGFEELKSGFLTLYYNPSPEGFSRFKKNTCVEVLNMMIDKNYFQDNIVNQLSRDFDSFFENVLRKRPQLLKVKLNAHLLYISGLLMDMNLPSDLSRIFFKEKIIEILTLMASQLRSNDNHFSFSKPDREKLYYVREILKEKPEYPWSLKIISKQVALNEFKLKKGFKELYRQTIFAYLLELRLTKAYKMLSESDITIGDAAYFTGYTNPQHFSTAFKRFFGVSPIKLRKSK